MKLKTIQADNLLSAFSMMMKNCKGIVGYALAKNVRLLNTELTEYNNIKQELFRKYGEEDKGQLVIKKESDNFQKYLEEIKPYNDIEIEIDFMKVKEKDLIDSGLTGEEMYLLLDYIKEDENGI